MKMNIVVAKPPIWDQACKHFPIDTTKVVFAWGEMLYNPGNVPVDDALNEHEDMHRIQQLLMGGPELWWQKYFKDPVWRAQQEAEAYGKQYAYVCRQTKDKLQRARYLGHIVADFSGGMYGINMLPEEARLAILQRA